MGAGQSNGPMDPASIRRCFDPAGSFKAGRGKLRTDGSEEPGCDALAAYSILGAQYAQRVEAVDALLQQLRGSAANGAGDAEVRAKDRSLGCMLGNIVGDALGAPLEFSPVRYGVRELQGMDHDEIWKNNSCNSFNLKPGQWTDDGSMALCIMDSLLCCNGFNGLDVRQRFHAWNEYGYNNAFGRDHDCSSRGRGSVGLGGNISMSMTEWKDNGTAQTIAGDKFASGNGSVMRNGALPVWFREHVKAGMDSAFMQSRTTHGGEEAAELCRLLTFICVGFISGAGREMLDDLIGFKSELYNVMCLANSTCEELHEHNAHACFGGLERRQWRIQATAEVTQWIVFLWHYIASIRQKALLKQP